MAPQFWKNLRERAGGFLFWIKSAARSLCPFSTNAGIPAYMASIIYVVLLWCLANVRVWPRIWHHHLTGTFLGCISSGTVVTVAVGLTTIPLAVSIMTGEMYKGHPGRLRVLLKESRVQLVLIATVTTAIASAALGGWFCGWLASIYLSLVAVFSCYSVFRVLNLLLHPGEFAKQWGQFILSRQQRITSQSAFRQRKADAATATFASWGKGNDIKIDQWFEHFHRADLDKYAKITAGRIGQIDDINLPTVCRQLTILQAYVYRQARKNTSNSTDISATADSSSREMPDDRTDSPLVVIVRLPESLINNPDETILLFRKDIVHNTWVCRNIASSLRRAFRIDNSDHILEMAADLRSEGTELRDELMRGIRSNNQTMVSDFGSVSLYVIGAARNVMSLQPSTAARRVYCEVLDVLMHAVNDARHLVERSSENCDEEVRSLVLSLSSSMAYSAAETGNPEVFQSCLWPLKLQYQDALQQRPNPQEIHHGLFSYGILSSVIQRLAEQNTSAKTSIEPAVAEAKILLQSLSSLLLFFAREHNWAAATSVAKEISDLEPRPELWRKDAAPSGEYPARFRKLMSLAYYGLHACLVDLAMEDPTASVPHNLVEATWPNDGFDLPGLLSVYTLARAECADGQSWGWEPEPVSGVMFSPRTDEILVRGFVAIALTFPESALFQDLSDWLTNQMQKLEQAAGGASELRQLLGAGSQLDKVLKDGGEIAKLVAATSQDQDGADRAVGALRKLLDYVQTKTADEERMRIQNACVSVEVIQGWPKSVVQQYDTSREPGIAILKKLKLLLPTETRLSGTGNKLGIGDLDDKRWYLGQEPGSWTDIGKEYAGGLLRGEQEAVIDWLAKISSPIELSSVIAHESHVDESKAILVVNSGVYLLPPSLKDMVKISESANPDRGDPLAFFEISGKQIPMYQFFGRGMKSCLLFINSSNSAHTIPVPWKAEDGWTLSKTGEVKARLRVPSQDDSVMDELLGQHAPWLEEKAHTDKEKKKYLSRLVWPEACLQLAFDVGATPSVLRLDLPSDEPDSAPQGKDKSAD